MSNDLLEVLGRMDNQPADKPGKTTLEIAEESGLSQKKVQDLLKAGCQAGKVSPVKWIDQEHWSGRPRQVVCWKVK